MKKLQGINYIAKRAHPMTFPNRHAKPRWKEGDKIMG